MSDTITIAAVERELARKIMGFHIYTAILDGYRPIEVAGALSPNDLKRAVDVEDGPVVPSSSR